MKRRDFLLTAACTAAAVYGFEKNALGKPVMDYDPDGKLESTGLRIRDVLEILKKGEKNNTAPVIREEILENPTAVFIVYAGINNEKDENGKWKHCNDQFERLGNRVGELVFRKGTVKGGRTILHTNLVGGISGSNPTFINGNIVHPYFTVGMADILHGLGNTNTATTTRGALYHPQIVESGLGDLFNNHNLPLIEAHVAHFEDYDKSELMWHKNPEGVIARRFPTYKPLFQKGTTLINIAHAHTHPVGLTTLTIKNHMGMMPRGYGHTCDAWVSLDITRKAFMDDFNRDYRIPVENSYVKHAEMGYKYWDPGDFYKSYKSQGGYDAFMKVYRVYEKSEGDERKKAFDQLHTIANPLMFWVEQWSQRICDSLQALQEPYLNMVEGVFSAEYGGSVGILQSDFLTIGRSVVAVDAITSYIMGHDPRELPYLRIAKERGLGENDIEKIPIFILSEEGIEKVTDYRTLKRTPIGIYTCDHGPESKKIRSLGPRFY